MQELSALPQHQPDPQQISILHCKGLNTHMKQIPNIFYLTTTEPNMMDFKVENWAKETFKLFAFISSNSFF